MLLRQPGTNRAARPHLRVLGDLVVTVSTLLLTSLPSWATDRPVPVHNVIVMVSDGCSLEHLTLARWFKGAPLALDAIRTGSLRTHAVGSIVGESAAASTAMATGHLSRAKRLGLAPVPAGGPNDLPSHAGEMRPFATLLEGARLGGRHVGLAVTAAFTHATPAGFFAHVGGRGETDVIASQGAHAGLDLVLAGGWGFVRPRHAGGQRDDEQDLVADIERQGCEVVRTGTAMEASRARCLWGLFADEALTPVIDRPEAGSPEPTLAEMTREALKILSQDDKGFVLMVEGSQIDWAAHANDPGMLVREILAFDQSVGVALDFARRDGHTLLLAISDHATGGMWIEDHQEPGVGAVDALVGRLGGMTCSASRLVERLGPEAGTALPEDVQRVVRAGWGLAITPQEAADILRTLREITKPNDRENAFGEVLSERYLGVGWGSHDHNGGDVPLHAFGPGRPTGTLSLPEVATLCAGALGIDLEAATQRLFVDLGDAFTEAAVTVGPGKEGSRSVFVDLGRGDRAELPLNSARLALGGSIHALEGLVIEVPSTGRLYAPRQAVDLMRAWRDRRKPRGASGQGKRREGPLPGPALPQ